MLRYIHSLLHVVRPCERGVPLKHKSALFVRPSATIISARPTDLL